MTGSTVPFGLPEVSRAGVPTFRRSLEEQVVQVLSTGTLQDTFYASATELAHEAIDVLIAMRDKNPVFLGKALVWARNVALLRTAPILGLVVLSTAKDKRPFRTAFPAVIQIPDDLISFVEICRSGAIRAGLGGVALEATKLWLQNASEFHTLKYSGKTKKGKMSLQDVLRMAHPNPTSPAVAERFAWLRKGFKGSQLTSNHQIAAFEALKRTKDEAEVLRLIREGRLPVEVVIPALKASTTLIWTELMRQMPYLSLVRRLASLEKHGVFNDPANLDYVVGRLTDPVVIHRSKVLPFQMFQAWKQVVGQKNHRQELAAAMQTALELTFDNMPALPGRIAIAPDVSSSMRHQVGRGSSMSEIAGLFAAAFYKKCEGEVMLLPFREHLVDLDVEQSESLVAIAERIARLANGGTALAAPIQKLLDERISVDVFIGITDNEDWASRDRVHPDLWDRLPVRGNFLTLWREYKRTVNPDCVAILLSIAPYRDAVAPAGEPDVHFVYGWSDRVVSYVGSTLTLRPGEKVKEISTLGEFSLPPGSPVPEEDES